MYVDPGTYELDKSVNALHPKPSTSVQSSFKSKSRRFFSEKEVAESKVKSLLNETPGPSTYSIETEHSFLENDTNSAKDLKPTEQLLSALLEPRRMLVFA